ncbi:MAG: prepilin-type N-terminal cleavage/methylation domain-containing protein [Lentisphaerae bacterium]|nr:prepilin-type N-terminal cleavage/methylation domain-containing protein [Lentisphaerota bacterium]
MKNKQGFTLLEVVIAIAILTISAISLIEATSRCVAAIRQSSNYQKARFVLKQGELDHPLIKTNTPEMNEVFDVKYDDNFTFSRELVQSDDEENLYQVTTRVKWSERGKSSYEEVESLFYYPPEEDILE